MAYMIGFLERNSRAVLSTEVPSANHALAFIAKLGQSARDIEFIRSPQEGEIGIEMLRLLAKEEAEEMPANFRALDLARLERERLSD